MILFIYSKDGKVRVEPEIVWTNELHNNAIADGYKHTATIDSKIFVEYLCNECEDLGDEIKQLIGGANT